MFKAHLALPLIIQVSEKWVRANSKLFKNFYKKLFKYKHSFNAMFKTTTECVCAYMHLIRDFMFAFINYARDCRVQCNVSSTCKYLLNICPYTLHSFHETLDQILHPHSYNCFYHHCFFSFLIWVWVLYILFH